MKFRAAGIALIAILSVTAGAAAWLSASPQDRYAREDARLRAHFARVEAVLADREVPALTAGRRAARARYLRELHAYAREGRFPRNRGEANDRTPIFIDREGARCAMAHLIEHSGDRALAARVARTANLARIHDLAGDPELIAWLEDAGLTVGEAAMIQPMYGLVPSREDREDHVPDDSVMYSSVMLGLGMGAPAIWLNLHPGGRGRAARRSDAVLGTVTGISLLSVSIIDASHDGHLRGSGYFAMTVGAAAFLLSQMNLLNSRHAADRSADSQLDGAGMAVGDALRSQDEAGVAPVPAPPSPAPQRMNARLGLARGQSGEPQLAVHLSF